MVNRPSQRDSGSRQASEDGITPCTDPHVEDLARIATCGHLAALNVLLATVRLEVLRLLDSADRSGDVDEMNGEAVPRSVLEDIDVENQVASTLRLGPKIDQATPAIAEP